MSDASPGEVGDSMTLTRAQRQLIGFLRMVASITLLAFVAAIMPEKWIVEIAEELSIDPFPHSPLTFYLARNLSLLYGFGGIGLFVICGDFHRYRPLLPWLAAGTVAFGMTQWIVDAQSGLPIWWTLGESLSTIGGGILIGWLYRRTLA